MSGPIDLLLLNASNYPGQPIFPYAFVQVSALARARGLAVTRLDLLGRPRDEWPALIAEHIAEHSPRMVGFHIRQQDSQYLHQYKQVSGLSRPKTRYFPVDDTRWLIEQVRERSDAPVVVGGFGFSVHAARAYEFLGPDYGVCGGPDAFFEHFEALVSRDVDDASSVANLIWRDSQGVVQFGPREFFEPASHVEYDDRIFSELCQFYARHGVRLSLGGLGEVDVPVEIMRGCPCKCYFCTEPTVKGRKVRKRDLDVVMAEVEFLAARDVRCVWFICSELNMAGMSHPLALAERMQAFNRDRGSRRVLWKAYNMPRPGMTREQLRFMMSTGYIPGWNEFTSFDDTNLARTRMPYRSADVVAYLNDVLELSEDREIYYGPPLVKFEMFLGNAYMDAAALRNTLAVVDREGFQTRHPYGGAILATRVYELDGALGCGTSETSFSIGPEGPTESPDLLRPTFHYSPALLDALGSRARVEDFLRYVGSTFLSYRYRAFLDLRSFLLATSSPAQLAGHLATRALLGQLCSLHVQAHAGRRRHPEQEVIDARVLELWQDPSEVALAALLQASMPEASVANGILDELLRVLFQLAEPELEPLYTYLGIEAPGDRKTPYRVMRQLYARFEDEPALIEGAVSTLGLAPGSLARLRLHHILFDYNVRLEPELGELLFEPRAEPAQLVGS
ncbi:hypothetical protein G6O69_01775 [Pseudenhygromyxa sp. WMMC2535]|uniref:hypothetical protein n=1 Tax=Pseudenhygromyxa sp. WMMC2535 TaxID=2712867 RepID=UPI001552F207|nr:hypothetical protein [Pseudenhygromyxa sp. WMMC2535]NVB36543.1 hypothetical protein [Pseudenhygromyxa sp. WMMC2535]